MALHRAIVLVDIAGFTDPLRTAEDQKTVHHALYEMLDGTFAESGLDLERCSVEDRGDGAMVLVPPEFPKILLADQWPTRLAAALRRHNAVHSESSTMRLRVVLHAGEIHLSSNGVVSQAVNLAFRLLDAQAAREALAESGGVLALIASERFYEEVVLADPAADPTSYRRIPVSVKGTETSAWLRLPDRNGAAPRRETNRAARPGNIFELVDAVLDIAVVNDVAGRQSVLDLLRPEISASVPHDSRTRVHVVSLLRTCLRYDGGLAELVEVLSAFDGNTPAVRRLVEVSRNWPSDPPR
ncbi:effector-associated domain 2-containing protein [Umezawaea sp.]|uniref:effector-associated domain 2-containing protein n=1 Tax=Umezawaea sp. TaxID=1955258 RepID=UPI002ED2CEBB